MSPQEALARVIEHREIFREEMLSLMRQIMRGEVSPALIAAIITGLRVKKETIGEIAAAAQVMREFATRVEVADDRHLVDTCGTGGDAAHTFNISTAAAFVAAAAGARVAKHGGRSVSSKSGSADVLEALGAQQPRGAQQTQVMAHQRLRQAELSDQRADRAATLEAAKHDAQPASVTQQAEHIGKLADLILGQGRGAGLQGKDIAHRNLKTYEHVFICLIRDEMSIPSGRPRFSRSDPRHGGGGDRP